MAAAARRLERGGGSRCCCRAAHQLDGPVLDVAVEHELAGEDLPEQLLGGVLQWVRAARDGGIVEHLARKWGG